MWKDLELRLCAPIAPTSLVVFRALFGLLMAGSALRFLAHGWVGRFFGERTFFFKYWGFDWLTPASVAVMGAVYAALALLGVMIALGAFYRAATALFFVLFTYAELTDVTNYLNHYYLVSLIALLMVFMPLHAYGSVDAWRRPELSRLAMPAWTLYLLRFQIATVYFYAALAKLGPDFLLHGQPLNLWLSAHADLPWIGPWLLYPEVAIAASWAGFVHDLAIVPSLLWSKTRPYAYGALLAFHGLTATWFEIGIFPLLMPIGAMLFFPPTLGPFRLLLRWIGRRAELPAEARVRPASARLERWGVAAAGLYVLAQVLMPLRTHLYGGNVLWHEQGMRFSWRVMLRDKHGSVRYRVRLPGGREVVVPPRRYLTTEQEREMAGQPDLIVQLAQHVARDFERRGAGKVQVRADALVSLNGRPAAPLIDPSRDLVGLSNGLGPADWIMPAPQTLPFRLAPRWAHPGSASRCGYHEI